MECQGYATYVSTANYLYHYVILIIIIFQDLRRPMVDRRRFRYLSLP